jgi:hypothetical protein
MLRWVEYAVLAGGQGCLPLATAAGSFAHEKLRLLSRDTGQAMRLRLQCHRPWVLSAGGLGCCTGIVPCHKACVAGSTFDFEMLFDADGDAMLQLTRR